MRLSQWRPSFLAYLNQYVDFSGGFGLSVPEAYGVFVGHVPPLFRVSYSTHPPDSAIGYGEQWWFLLARYPYSTAYKDLPIALLEGLHCSLTLRFLWSWGRILDATARPDWNHQQPLLNSLELLTPEYPVQVKEDSYENRDWLVQLTWKARLMWNAEPENPIPSVLLTNLDLDVYRSTLRDITDATLDMHLPSNYE